jgi:FMN phosphatase YigB (HAD superfamily)
MNLNLIKIFFNKNILNIILIIILLIIILLCYYNMTNNTSNKIVVFDMDETLGSFQQLSIIVYVFEKIKKNKINQKEFNKLLDIFSNYLRTDIINILNYLKEKKIKKEVDKIIIFTNNQGPKEWARKIKNYLNYKVNYTLFDKIIGAYKIENDTILNERLRTSHEKKYNDLINILDLSKNTNICFIDDVYHENMDNEKIFYIHVNPYNYEYLVGDIIILLRKNFNYTNKEIIMYSKELRQYKVRKTNNINEKSNTKKILKLIQQFLKS